MKAYVIKNKEGKYWQFLHNDSEFVDKLYNAFLCYSTRAARNDIDSFGLEDCEVVEITIAEGDLEKENEVLRNALELACKELRDEYCRNCDAVSCEGEKEMCDHVLNMYPKQEFIEKALDQIEKGEKE